MKRFLILALAAALALPVLAACSGPAGGAGADGYRQVSADEAIELMNTESDYVILDVRTYGEFTEGHIPDAVCLPLDSINESDGKLAELPDKDQLILVYCRSGNRSKQASAKLAQLGYTNVVEFGGIKSWPGEVVTD